MYISVDQERGRGINAEYGTPLRLDGDPGRYLFGKTGSGGNRTNGRRRGDFQPIHRHMKWTLGASVLFLPRGRAWRVGEFNLLYSIVYYLFLFLISHNILSSDLLFQALISRSYDFIHIGVQFAVCFMKHGCGPPPYRVRRNKIKGYHPRQIQSSTDVCRSDRPTWDSPRVSGPSPVDFLSLSPSFFLGW